MQGYGGKDHMMDMGEALNPTNPKRVRGLTEVN
jgi:hypothetical protein